MDDKSAVKQKLAELIKEFDHLSLTGSLKGEAEQTARTWVEKFLEIFGWNC